MHDERSGLRESHLQVVRDKLIAAMKYAGDLARAPRSRHALPVAQNSAHHALGMRLMTMLRRPNLVFTIVSIGFLDVDYTPPWVVATNDRSVSSIAAAALPSPVEPRLNTRTRANVQALASPSAAPQEIAPELRPFITALARLIAADLRDRPPTKPR